LRERDDIRASGGWVARSRRAIRLDTRPEELPEGVWPLYFVAGAFWYTRRFGAFFLAGLVIDLLLSRI
jgi:hypothetical protein